MTTAAVPTKPELAATPALPCAGCGYDVRAHPRDGVCPECGAPVEKAVELAAVPYRPAWRDSDPRWRRRMAAGAWVMALVVPSFAALDYFGLAERLIVPTPFHVGPMPLSATYAAWIDPGPAFCIGLAFLFARERGRQAHRLDWTRRWGVLATCAVILLGVANFGFITALVMVGIASLFFTLPPANQPAITGLLASLGTGYLTYGPGNSNAVYVALAVVSACAVLLACPRLFEALRRTGPPWLALAVLAPLALTALASIVVAAVYAIRPATAAPPAPFFFEPASLLPGLGDLVSTVGGQWVVTPRRAGEVAKWLAVLVIALWLTAAQVQAWRTPRPGRDAAA